MKGAGRAGAEGSGRDSPVNKSNSPHWFRFCSSRARIAARYRTSSSACLTEGWSRRKRTWDARHKGTKTLATTTTFRLRRKETHISRWPSLLSLYFSVSGSYGTLFLFGRACDGSYAHDKARTITMNSQQHPSTHNRNHRLTTTHVHARDATRPPYLRARLPQLPNALLLLCLLCLHARPPLLRGAAAGC